MSQQETPSDGHIDDFVDDYAVLRSVISGRYLTPNRMTYICNFTSDPK